METFNFALVMPNGQAINNDTELTKNGIPYKIMNEVDLCDFMKRAWMVRNGSKSFADWAKILNESCVFECQFQMEDALENLANLFVLNIGKKHVDIYQFFQTYKPFKI